MRKHCHFYWIWMKWVVCLEISDFYRYVCCPKVDSVCPDVTLFCHCISFLPTCHGIFILLICKLHSFWIDNDFEALRVVKGLKIYFLQIYIQLWALLRLKNGLRLVHIVVEPTLYDALFFLSPQFEKFLCVSSSPLSSASALPLFVCSNVTSRGEGMACLWALRGLPTHCSDGKATRNLHTTQPSSFLAPLSLLHHYSAQALQDSIVCLSHTPTEAHRGEEYKDWVL